MNKQCQKIKKVREVKTCHPGTPDDMFVCFASFEDRCLGVVRRFRDYSFRHSYIFRITDEPSKAREENLKELRELLSNVGNVTFVDTQHRDPIIGMRFMANEIENLRRTRDHVSITVDISTFTKKQLLLMLRTLDMAGVFSYVRMLYTEPEIYAPHLNQPISYGLKEVAVIPTFTCPFDPQQELVLAMFLGYEGDRSLALWENIEPHRTVAVIGRPAFHPEWEGKTEEMNAAFLSAIDKSAILYADTRNPHSTTDLLENLIKPELREKVNWYIAPIGTKLQAVGVYYFISKYPESASIVYASPLIHNEEFLSRGIGETIEVPQRV